MTFRADTRPAAHIKRLEGMYRDKLSKAAIAERLEHHGLARLEEQDAAAIDWALSQLRVRREQDT